MIANEDFQFFLKSPIAEKEDLRKEFYNIFDLFKQEKSCHKNNIRKINILDIVFQKKKIEIQKYLIIQNFNLQSFPIINTFNTRLLILTKINFF